MLTEIDGMERREKYTKRLTIDDFAVAFVSALGYGFGYEIASLWGWPIPACLAACFAGGIALDWLMNKIVFSETVRKKHQIGC